MTYRSFGALPLRLVAILFLALPPTVLGIQDSRPDEVHAGLHSGDPTTVVATLERLAGEASPRTEYVPRILSLTASSDANVNRAAHDLIRTWSAGIANELGALLLVPDRDLVLAALRQVGRLRQTGALATVKTLMVQGDPGIEAEACRTLFEFADADLDAWMRSRHDEYDGRAGAPGVEDAEASRWAVRRTNVVFYLAQRRHPDALRLLVAELDRPFPYGRQIAVRLLARQFPDHFVLEARVRCRTAPRDLQGLLLDALTQRALAADRGLGFAVWAETVQDRETRDAVERLLKRTSLWLGTVVPNEDIATFACQVDMTRAADGSVRSFPVTWRGSATSTDAFTVTTLELPLADALMRLPAFVVGRRVGPDGRATLTFECSSGTRARSRFGIGSEAVGLWFGRDSQSVTRFEVDVDVSGDPQEVRGFDEQGHESLRVVFSEWRAVDVERAVPLAILCTSPRAMMTTRFVVDRGVWHLAAARYFRVDPTTGAEALLSEAAVKDVAIEAKPASVPVTSRPAQR